MYNNIQQQIIDCTEPNVIIDAGPGTGKTHTLIGAVEKYKKSHPYSDVALITFTNKAADEMEKRLSTPVEYVGTIHGFAKKYLYVLAEKYQFRVRFLQDEQIKQILSHLLSKHNLKQLNRDYIERQSYKYIMYKSLFIKDNKVYPIYEIIEQQYEEYKTLNELYDNRDSPKYLLDKLRAYQERISLDKIFLDEAQDLDPVQYELLQYFDCDKFIIGDPKQSIYLFRGASKEVFNAFIESGYKLFKLEHNYRSKQEILQAAGSDLVAIKGFGGGVYWYDDVIFDYKPMILCRTNKEVNEIKEYYPHVSTIHGAKGLEYDSVLISEFDIETEEDINVLFVAMTRAKDNLGVMDFDSIMFYLENNGRMSDF